MYIRIQNKKLHLQIFKTFFSCFVKIIYLQEPVFKLHSMLKLNKSDDFI